MQTFLPRPDFVLSAQALDTRRLNKQMVETYQLALGLLRVNPDGTPKVGRTWADHPMGRMWKGHLGALLQYQGACNLVLTQTRTKKSGAPCQNSCYDKMYIMVNRHGTPSDLGGNTTPSWFGDEDFHVRHQSNLLRKADEYYVKHSSPHACHEPGGCEPMRMHDWYDHQFPGVPHDLAYAWPSA